MYHKKIFLKINSNKLFYSFISLIFLIKVYLVFLNPKPIEATSVSWTWFDFYNAKQFLINPSSFTDPGHPGTPIYYIYYIILSLLGPEIKNFQKFIYINHLLYFFVELTPRYFQNLVEVPKDT